MNPVLTLIVPVYNTQAFLPECLDSILAQSLSKAVMEVLLINDASPDESLSILNAYQTRHPELFRVINQPMNQGLGVSRNLGISQAKGDYIGFVDSDDTIHPKMYEVLVQTAQSQLADYAEAGMTLFDQQASQPIQANSAAEKTSVCNKIFSRRFIQQHQLTFAEGELFEDEIFSYLASYYATSCVTLEHSFYNYRVNPNGICRSAEGDVKRLYARMTSLVDFLETLRERHLLKRLRQQALEMICRHALLQLKSRVSWVDLLCYWRFSAHLIQRYGLQEVASERLTKSPASYFVAKFFKLSQQHWRLWLLRHYLRYHSPLIAKITRPERFAS